MEKRMVWKTRAAGLALLAIVSFAARAQGSNVDPRNGDDPNAYRQLDGVWQCHFLKTNNALEKQYYSNWTFDAAEKKVVAYWSPVHKGDWFRYAWNGIKLVLDYPWGPPSPRFGTFDARFQNGSQTDLTIEMPKSRWGGWRCHRQPTAQWPDDKLQFLDYTRYPWLSSSIEDGPSIMQYREPKQYQEWLKSRPR